MNRMVSKYVKLATTFVMVILFYLTISKNQKETAVNRFFKLKLSFIRIKLNSYMLFCFQITYFKQTLKLFKSTYFYCILPIFCFQRFLAKNKRLLFSGINTYNSK